MFYRMKMKNKKTPYIVIIIILLLAFMFVGVHSIAPYAVLQPQRVHLDKTPKDLGLESDEWIIEVENNIKLNGYWVKTDALTPKSVVIFVHGIGGCKEHFLELAAELSEQGIESVLFDLRAHGESGGEYTTYGYDEKKDVKKIVDYIKNKAPNVKIGIWGNSLGGAIAIQALEYDNRLEFGIIESTFTSLNQIVYDYKKRYLKGIGVKFLSDYVLKRAGYIGGFNPNEVKPLNSVKQIEQPTLIAHGDSDENISYTYGKQLYDNLATPEKTFVLVKGGGHLNMFEKGGEDYKNKIMNFINLHLKNE